MDEAIEDEGIYHWRAPGEVSQTLQKYWYQRNKIWERYDDGIWMTMDAWFGVTPEPIANKIAVHIAESTPAEKTIIVDAFAGVGGNAIALARSDRWKQVFAIEKDAKTMKCAKHNAKLYGVDKKIMWVTGDCFDVLRRRFSGNDSVVIFASPPWGGVDYGDQDVFDLSKMMPYNLEKLYTEFSKYSKHVILYLPRTSDLNQIARYAPADKKVDVAHYCLTGASKALCVYYGDFDFGEEEKQNENTDQDPVQGTGEIDRAEASGPNEDPASQPTLAVEEQETPTESSTTVREATDEV